MQINREKAATLMQPASSPEAMVDSVTLIILLTASLQDTTRSTFEELIVLPHSNPRNY